MNDKHADFSGSIPAAYDRYLGPVLFQTYAEELAARIEVGRGGSVLELACGTGILSRVLRDRLPADAAFMATDLNEGMLHVARAKFSADEAVRWSVADASSLPFGDGLFDAVVCQFGLMFVPEKLVVAREVCRVLKPGGVFLFNVWGPWSEIPWPGSRARRWKAFSSGIRRRSTECPLAIMTSGDKGAAGDGRLPRDRPGGGGGKVSGASTAADLAKGFVDGNPISVAIAERDRSLSPKITAALSSAIEEEFGATEVRAPMQVIVAQART